MKTKLVYIYARWSTHEQATGSTLERQITNCVSYNERLGRVISTKPIVDSGKSAYTGANIKSGNLAKFVAELRTGEIDPAETILTVEELDRLSRQDAVTMLGWLGPVLGLGLTIEVAKSGQIIDHDMMTNNIAGLMTVLITAFGSHHESKKKAERVGAAWQQKRDKLAAGEVLPAKHHCPHWLEIENGAFVVLKERERLVKMIFANRLKGIGKETTARQFNELMKTDPAFNTWGRGKRKAKYWTGTYVGRILNNPAVMGYWQPHTHPRGGERKPIGEPVMIYPQLIDRATFDKANDGRLDAQMRAQGKGRAVSNLFGPKARCGRCGAKMDAMGSARVRINKKGEKHQHYFLYCSGNKRTKTCDHSLGWSYQRIETPLLDALLERAMDDQHFAVDDGCAELEMAVFAARRDAKDAAARLKRALMVANNIDDEEAAEAQAVIVGERGKESTAAKAALEQAEENLATARGKVSPAEHVRRVSEIRGMMENDDPEERYQARSRAKAALQDIVERADFDDRRGIVTVRLLGEMAVIHIWRNGRVGYLDLVHPQRKSVGASSEQQEVIDRFIRRNQKAA
ncbi:recombinase family protein [Croceicoccus bisphenolivorans]|uniref:recombinase family protein n=1 Tax=Croceicoccus bisphenolivorans TaxID=1783232 RepID=UPI0009ECEBDE|nr:recombinase family protein [Croceicoccus bisphenolivorans]